MVHQGPLPVSFLDLILRGILVNSQDLVVIFPLALLQFQLCVLEELFVFWSETGGINRQIQLLPLLGPSPAAQRVEKPW